MMKEIQCLLLTFHKFYDVDTSRCVFNVNHDERLTRYEFKERKYLFTAGGHINFWSEYSSKMKSCLDLPWNSFTYGYWQIITKNSYNQGINYDFGFFNGVGTWNIYIENLGEVSFINQGGCEHLS